MQFVYYLFPVFVVSRDIVQVQWLEAEIHDKQRERRDCVCRRRSVLPDPVRLLPKRHRISGSIHLLLFAAKLPAARRLIIGWRVSTMCSYRDRGVDGSYARHLTVESYTVIYAANSHTYY